MQVANPVKSGEHPSIQSILSIDCTKFFFLLHLPFTIYDCITFTFVPIKWFRLFIVLQVVLLVVPSNLHGPALANQLSSEYATETKRTRS